MATKNEYERIGKFIYSACRYGAEIADVHNWMADELKIARLADGDELAQQALYTAYFATYVSDDDFQSNYLRFVETIKNRAS